MFDEKCLKFFFFNFLALNLWLWYVNKFQFSVQFWTEILAETKRWNDTETETETHTETETETEIFRSLVLNIIIFPFPILRTGTEI
jgi:hypothetical protein